MVVCLWATQGALAALSASAAGDIIEPATLPGLDLYDDSTYQGDTGTTTPRSTRAQPPSSTPVTFTWTTVDGTATAPSDYVAGAARSPSPGFHLGELLVTVDGDTDIEPDEYLTVAIANVTGATYARRPLRPGRSGMMNCSLYRLTGDGKSEGDIGTRL